MSGDEIATSLEVVREEIYRWASTREGREAMEVDSDNPVAVQIGKNVGELFALVCRLLRARPCESCGGGGEVEVPRTVWPYGAEGVVVETGTCRACEGTGRAR